MSLTLTGAAYAQGNFKVIHSFGCDDGNYLDHGVTLDAAGNLYGVTHEYGCGMGLGAVFKLTPNADGSWAESVIHIFYGPPDAYPPTSGVIFDADGNLYGTGFDGGDYGWGAVYRLTLNSDGSWSETIIHSLMAVTTEGGHTDWFLMRPATCTEQPPTKVSMAGVQYTNSRRNRTEVGPKPFCTSLPVVRTEVLRMDLWFSTMPETFTAQQVTTT
jgi:hypothetical protein